MSYTKVDVVRLPDFDTTQLLSLQAVYRVSTSSQNSHLSLYDVMDGQHSLN